MNYVKKTILILFVSYTITAAQQVKPNNIFLEVFGNAGAYSINYDRVLWSNISVRGGMMLLPSDSKPITSVPLLMNYRFYIGSNYVETGLGATFFSSSLNFGKLGEKSAEGKIFTGVISYCLQAESGINARISFTPFFYNQEFIPFGGFSFGYSF
jgi:hypothetical protein